MWRFDIHHRGTEGAEKSEFSTITGEIVGVVTEEHGRLGSGLRELAYEEGLGQELTLRRIVCER
jgi:hypothetical protein